MIGARPAVGFLVHPREAGHAGLVSARRRAEAHGAATWVAGADPRADVVARAQDTGLLVTIGGDGTFLLGARLGAPLGIPVLGVNRGQLGFLTDVDLDGLPQALDAVAAGDYRLSRRSLLEIGLEGVAAPPGVDLALNEVAVKAMGSHLARLRVDADDDLLGEFDADGVIVATATGSTAYALSAGGPPIDPRVRAIVVVPLAAHAVITRAVVLPEALGVRVTLVRGRAFAAADGSGEIPLGEGRTVVVRPGPELAVVEPPGALPFVRRLRQKLHFGQPLKQVLDGPEASRVASPGALGKE